MHSGAPSFSYQFHAYYYDVPEDEGDSRVQIDSDLRWIAPEFGEAGEDAIYCIRAVSAVSISNSKQPFTWGIWVTQAKDSFDNYVATFNNHQSDMGTCV